jgi:hypothetical protein
MDWQIKTIAGKCCATSIDFNPGDSVLSLIFKDEEENTLGRADILSEEQEQFELPGALLGRWTRVIKEDGATEFGPQEQAAAAEDFFCSLYDEAQESSDENGADERLALKHLLALLLERKRILRAVGVRAKSGIQVYRHPKLEREFEVPVVEVSKEMTETIMETMGDVFLQL